MRRLTAAAAFCEALTHVEGTRDGVPITQEAATLAVAIGVTTSAARGETGRLNMLVSALNHMRVAYDEHSHGIDTRKLPAVRTAAHYARHAEELRAMSDSSKHAECRAALDRCAGTFDRIAQSRDLVAASMLRLCKVA